MKKILIILLLLSVSLSVKSIGVYSDYFMLTTDSYNAMIPQDLAQPAIVQNDYSVNLVPKISVDDTPAAFSLVPTAGLFDNPSDKYVVENTETISDIEIYAKVSIEWNQIVCDIRVRNTGANPTKIDFEYPLKGENKIFALFSPENYINRSANYMVLAQPELDGQALAIIGSQEIKPNFDNVLVDRNYPITFSLPALSPGETFSLQIKYFPFVLKEAGTLDYPIELYSFMSEPLIKVSGIANQTVTGTLDEKIAKIMDIVNVVPKKTGEFSGIHDVDLRSAELDSLDSSVYFKQLCIKSDVPCRLVVGKKDENYYAWVKAWNGNWVDIDVLSNARQAPAYDPFYLEPQTELHTMPFSDDKMKMVYEGTSWIGSMGQLGFLLYFIIIIVAAVGIVVSIMFKKIIFGKLLASRGVIGKPSIDVDGKYEVLSEEIDDPFLREIIKRIKEKGGMVNINQLVEEMHFSKQLVEDGVRYLADQKFIKKIM
jgi:hypothetical protein